MENFLYELLSEKWCGNHCVPLDHRILEFKSRHGCEEVVMFSNDAFEIGFGWPNRWHMFYRREDFHRIIFWYLRQWAFGEWFGLRRIIWYWLLHRRCERHNKYGLKAAKEKSWNPK